MQFLNFLTCKLSPIFFQVNVRYWKSGWKFKFLFKTYNYVSQYTQPDLTLFYFIFTYLWGRYHWSFRNVAIYNFFSHKPTKVTSNLILDYLKKVIEGATTNIKTNTKTLISSIWIRPKGVPGVSNDAPGSTKHAIWGLVH